tara:strand:+ start:531 stop:668 length:138 start_codon:yes stop_codon:yes gene_type:complete
MEFIAVEKVQKIDEIYKSIENFCVVTLQAYYCENLEESISDFRKF